MLYFLLWLAAADPTVAFTLQEGFVTVLVQKDGQPVAGAILKVYDGSTGPPLVEGETDDQGRGVFVLPNPTGLIGITIQGKECDLIPVKLAGDTLTPARVSLTFGTRPCCQVGNKADRAVHTDAPLTPPYLIYATLALAVVVMAVTAVLVARSGPPPSAPPSSATP